MSRLTSGSNGPASSQCAIAYGTRPAAQPQRYADMRGSRYEVIRAELRLIPALVFIPARLALNARDVARSRYACA
jgi:hypothetical protein